MLIVSAKENTLIVLLEFIVIIVPLTSYIVFIYIWASAQVNRQLTRRVTLRFSWNYFLKSVDLLNATRYHVIIANGGNWCVKCDSSEELCQSQHLTTIDNTIVKWADRRSSSFTAATNRRFLSEFRELCTLFFYVIFQSSNAFQFRSLLSKSYLKCKRRCSLRKWTWS